MQPSQYRRQLRQQGRRMIGRAKPHSYQPEDLMAHPLSNSVARLDPRKFRNPLVTASGDRRAQVALKSLETLWFNTGTLCNLTCRNCYIESSPKNDRLGYLSAAEVAHYLDE